MNTSIEKTDYQKRLNVRMCNEFNAIKDNEAARLSGDVEENKGLRSPGSAPYFELPDAVVLL
jgi:hypothetical protein